MTENPWGVAAQECKSLTTTQTLVDVARLCGIQVHERCGTYSILNPTRPDSSVGSCRAKEGMKVFHDFAEGIEGKNNLNVIDLVEATQGTDFKESVIFLRENGFSFLFPSLEEWEKGQERNKKGGTQHMFFVSKKDEDMLRLVTGHLLQPVGEQEKAGKIRIKTKWFYDEPCRKLKKERETLSATVNKTPEQLRRIGEISTYLDKHPDMVEVSIKALMRAEKNADQLIGVSYRDGLFQSLSMDQKHELVRHAAALDIREKKLLPQGIHAVDGTIYRQPVPYGINSFYRDDPEGCIYFLLKRTSNLLREENIYRAWIKGQIESLPVKTVRDLRKDRRMSPQKCQQDDSFRDKILIPSFKKELSLSDERILQLERFQQKLMYEKRNLRNRKSS